jgi:hypothetical protein
VMHSEINRRISRGTMRQANNAPATVVSDTHFNTVAKT